MMLFSRKNKVDNQRKSEEVTEIVHYMPSGKEGQLVSEPKDGSSRFDDFDNIFFISKQNWRKWLSLWLVVGFLFLFDASQSSDASFTRLGERLPYFIGFFAAIGHSVSNNELQANRAFCTAFASVTVVHLLPLMGLSGVYYICKSKRFFEGKYSFKLDRKVLRRFFVMIRIFCVIMMCIGAISEAAARSKFPKIDSSVTTKRLDWMKDFENRTFFDLFIPGSHNSGAITGDFIGSPFFLKMIEPLSATNTLTITEQLEMGARYIDLRLCGAADGNAFICHGPVLHYGKFEDALKQVNAFVEKNPSEVVLVYAKPEASEFFLSNRLEREIYQPIILEFDEFVEKLISPEEALNFTLRELTDDGKNIMFGSDADQGSSIFQNVTKFWRSDIAPETYFEDFYYDHEVFKAHLIENVCTGTSIEFEPNDGEMENFTQSVRILQGQVSGNAGLQVVHLLFPMLATALFGGTHLEGSSLLEISAFTNSLLLDMLLDDECTGYQDFNVITHDFLDDNIIQSIINKNLL